MKYLIINGSPHKGNTWELAELMKDYLLELDENAVFEEIHLMQIELPFCCGCSNCFRLGFETCPHYEKVGRIVKAIEHADGVIIVSTTYMMRETALLKNLFDHLCFFLHRPYFFKSRAMILTTTGAVGAKAATKSIAATLEGIGFNHCYLFGKPSYSWNDYHPTQKTRKALQKMTGKFYQDIISKKLYSPSCGLLIPYNLFRGMSLSYAKGSEYPTKDGEYWTEECRRKGVYDASIRIPFYKKPVGHLFYLIGKFAGKQKRILVTYKMKKSVLKGE